MERAGKSLARLKISDAISTEELARAAWPAAVGKRIASQTMLRTGAQSERRRSRQTYSRFETRYYPILLGESEGSRRQQQGLRLRSSRRYFTLGESLGGVKALLCHPATMTHASIPPEARAELGLSDTLIRLSPGCESADDLVEDLLEGLSQVESARAARKTVTANAG